MGWIFFNKEVGPQTLSPQIGSENGFRNGFDCGLLFREIDSKKLIEEAFHCSYLNRNCRVKSRNDPSLHPYKKEGAKGTLSLEGQFKKEEGGGLLI